MSRLIIIISVLSTVAVFTFSTVYAITNETALFSLAITFGTISYHFRMRLIVGLVFNFTMKNRTDYTIWWFRIKAVGKKLYKALKVKKWKDYMPAFAPENFDKSKRSWDEIAQATCQSELVHETIVLLSFVPVAFSVVFGELAVFLITSSAAALFDLLFVIMQRYNCPRIIRMLNKKTEEQINRYSAVLK